MEMGTFDEILGEILANSPRISDINLTPGRPPQIEVDGTLREATVPSFCGVLSGEHTAAFAEVLLSEDRVLRDRLKTEGSCDTSWALGDGRRFRVNVFRVGRHLSIVLRCLPSRVPTFEDLALPESLHRVPELVNGLVLVTGATGSGKSTTLAAIVDAINRTRAVHIVTLEDPVEYLHAPREATVNQRELGVDFPDYKDGLRAALRQAPKVILVGEIRDRDTVEIALKAAETGHLVLSTLHTIDAGQTISRIIGLFDPLEERFVRQRLAQTLRFVVSQRLVPKEAEGRVAVQEILAMNLRVRELVLGGETEDKTFYQVVSEGRTSGMQTFDQHLVELFSANTISADTARLYASDTSVVLREVDRIRVERGEDTSGLGRLEMARNLRQSF